MSAIEETALPAQDVGSILGTPLYQTARMIFRLTTTLMFDFKTYGVRNVPEKGGVLLVGNHQSYLDPILYAVHLKRALSFMAKSELFEGSRLFEWVIRNMNAFPVKQGRFDRNSLRETVNRLRAGRIVVLFPEGGRTDTGEIEPLQRGVGLIVRQAGPGVKVVPAAVHGAYQAWNRYHKLPMPCPIQLEYGPAMDLSQLQDKEVVATIDREIRRLYEGLKGRVAS